MDNIIKTEVTITRIFNAPRRLVWKVWTEPTHLKEWWGPKNFTNPVCKADFTVNGNIYIEMRAPDDFSELDWLYGEG